MKEASLIPDELGRVAALERYGILDTHPDAIFDCITQAAAEICETPIGLISLVDPDRQWFKSRVGLEAQETLRKYAFCSHTFHNPLEIMEVEDASLDDRFHDNPLVTDDPKIRFYAGKPLVTPDGHALGTLCVIDQIPRSLTDSQRRSLSHLAEAVMTLIEERAKSPISAIGRAIEENNPHGLLVAAATDSGFQITYCNRGYEGITGFKEVDILGKSDKFLRDSQADPNSTAVIESAIAKGEKLTVVLKSKRRNGTAFWNETSLIPIRNLADEVTHYLFILQDITDRFQAQEELRSNHERLQKLVAEHAQSNILLQQEVEQRRRSEAQFRRFIESAPDATVIINKYATIEIVNHRTELMFGIHRDDLQGMKVGTLIPGLSDVDYSMHKEAFSESYAAISASRSLQLLAHTADERQFPVEITLSTVGDQGNPLVSASIRDISRRLKMEDQTRELQNELAHVSRLSTMSHMATGLAHELNQPLTAISQCADAALVSLTEYPDLDPEILEIVKDIDSEAQRAGDIIRSLRRLIGKNSPTPLEIELNVLVLQTVQLMTPDARTNNIVIHTDTSPIPNATGDRVQIAQVMVNLIRNSIEAISMSDSKLRSITVRTRHDESFVTITVEDTGPGFCLKANAFEQFESSKQEGMGIGLSISTKIIDIHGGRLWNDKDDEPGARMSFTLPISSVAI